MQELEIVREKIQNHYRVVKTDEDLEWNRAIDLCTNIINAHLSRENATEIARSSRDNDGWIPVEKELPPEPPEYVDDEDDLEEYIVMIDGAERPTTLRYAGDGTWWEDGTYYHVIAWCPLPERYRPESKTEKPDWREDMLRKFNRRR